MTTSDDALAERARRLRARGREGRTISREDLRRHTRRSVLTGAAAIAAGGLGFHWLQNSPHVDGIPATLRRGHEFNADLWRVIGGGDQVREFPEDRIEDLRLNGDVGLEDELDLAAWSMQVLDPDDRVLDEVVMDDLADLERIEMVVEHKCIEGWSRVVQWGGIRFGDFAARYASRVAATGFVGLVTPDTEYYVGLTRRDMMHPQTLLADTLNGDPLTRDHGAPLRLVTPNHYGIKSLKRIGTIQFATERPADFWAERSYDWNSQL